MIKQSFIAMSVLALMAGAGVARADNFVIGNQPLTAIQVMNAETDETPSILYARCGNPQVGFMTGDIVDVDVSAAVYIPIEDVERYAGAKITSIIVASGLERTSFNNNNITDVTVFVSDDIYAGTYLTRQRGRLSKKALTWNEIKLSEPVEIKAGQPLFIGASVLRTTADDFPFATDATPRWDGKSFFLDYYLNGERHMWEDMTAQGAGSVCIKARVEGDALPTYDCEISNLSVPTQVQKNTPTEIGFRFTNRGANDVENAVITIKVGKQRTVSVPLNNLERPLGYNEGVDLYWNITCSDFGANIPVTVTVTEVNGRPDTYPDNSTLTASFLCIDPADGYDRKVVMEEGTGTWCPNCPRGLKGMEYMLDRYPDSFYGIAIHGGSGEPMAVDLRTTNYNPHLNDFVNYPNARFNRVDRLGNNVQFDFRTQMDGIYNTLTGMKSPSMITLDDAYYINDDKNVIEVLTTSEFTFSSSTEYGVAIVMTENGVGPYKQSNNFYGQGPEFGIFNEEFEPNITFDHVARYITDYNGDPESFPAEKSAATPYAYSVRIPMTYGEENMPILDSRKSFDLVALLINRESGEIENAAKFHCDENLPVKTSGIESVDAVSNVKVGVDNGSIIINGNYTAGRIVNFNGVTVRTLSGESSVEVAAGLYIVEIDGVATKVSVR